MEQATRIWHYGLVARWWAEFNQGGDDVEVFRQAAGRSGQPLLDAGCGTGRLLLPLLRAGIDADGSDASPDMLKWCRASAEREGLAVGLYPQAMHELDLPRRYRTILVCGAFGLGGSREQDLEGLRRLHAHLEPGGVLLMDHYLPNLEMPGAWKAWTERPQLPRPWPRRGDRRSAADGTELEIRARQVAFDPLDQTTTLGIRVSQYRDGEEIATETRTIHINLYFRNELELMLSVAGFESIEVTAFGAPRPARPWEDARILFEARA